MRMDDEPGFLPRAAFLRNASIDWRIFRIDVETLLKKVGADFYIKDDLRAFA